MFSSNLCDPPQISLYNAKYQYIILDCPVALKVRKFSMGSFPVRMSVSQLLKQPTNWGCVLARLKEDVTNHFQL